MGRRRRAQRTKSKALRLKYRSQVRHTWGWRVRLMNELHAKQAARK